LFIFSSPLPHGKQAALCNIANACFIKTKTVNKKAKKKSCQGLLNNSKHFSKPGECPEATCLQLAQNPQKRL
jgi:hypothetical protein